MTELTLLETSGYPSDQDLKPDRVTPAILRTLP
jgi:hypothetical protein